jgi:hypothetical protein
MHTSKYDYPQAHRYTTVVALHQDYPSFNIEPKGIVGDDNQVYKLNPIHNQARKYKEQENTKNFLIPISISYALYRSIVGDNQNRSRNQSSLLPSIYKPAKPITGGGTT